MKTKSIFFLGLLLFTTSHTFAATFTSANDGNWTTPTTWTPNGIPENDDEVIIDHAVILDVNMIGWSKGVSLLTINSTGSLIYAGTAGVQIDNDGFLTVSGIMNVYEVYFKGSAEVLINSGGQVTVQTNWSSQGENGEDLDPFVVNGSINVLGTFEDDGSTITGTGTITAGNWDLEGTFLFYNQYDPNNPPDPNQTLYGSTWEGTISSDWNTGANWLSQETPTNSDIAFIPAGLSVYPVVSNGIEAQCSEMILEPGATLTINPGGNMTVNTQVINEGTIILNSDATGTGSFIDGGFINGTGTAQVHRFFADLSGPGTFYVHQVCAPVSGIVLQDFDLIPGRTYAYEFLPLTGTWNNIFEYQTLMPPMRGIILSTLNNTGDQTPVFTGPLVTGDQAVAVTPAENGGEIALNLVGNPFPSPIDWEEMAPQQGISNYVYIWDPSVPEYKAYVKGTGGSNSCRYIQVGQAFFIGANQTAESLVFENTVRTHQNQPFLKSEASNQLEVSLSGGNGTGSSTHIRLKDGATTKYDESQEAEKWFSIYGEEANEIYSVSSDGTALQVAAFPLADAQPVNVSLNMKAATTGQYTLRFSGIESFSTDMKVFLEDKLNPAQGWHNIRLNEHYQFNAAKTDPSDRFTIHIGRDITAVGEQGDQEKLPVSFGAEAGFISVYNPSNLLIDQVSVYDLTGRKVTQKDHVNGSLIRISTGSNSGFYIIEAKADEGTITGKVFLR